MNHSRYRTQPRNGQISSWSVARVPLFDGKSLEDCLSEYREIEKPPVKADVWNLSAPIWSIIDCLKGKNSAIEIAEMLKRYATVAGLPVIGQIIKG